jgi:hypothetical protein
MACNRDIFTFTKDFLIKANKRQTNWHSKIILRKHFVTRIELLVLWYASESDPCFLPLERWDRWFITHSARRYIWIVFVFVLSCLSRGHATGKTYTKFIYEILQPGNALFCRATQRMCVSAGEKPKHLTHYKSRWTGWREKRRGTQIQHEWQI